MNDASSNNFGSIIKKIVLIFIALISLFGIISFINIPKKLEKTCRAEAKIIIEDPELWGEYVAAINEIYLAHKKVDPQYKLSIFTNIGNIPTRMGYFRYKHEKRRHSFFQLNKILRNDEIMTNNEKVVARFVNYTALTPKFIGTKTQSCQILYPELYATKELPYE